MCQYWLRDPQHPLPHLLYLDVQGWDPLLQHLTRLQVLPEPEALFFFVHWPLRHQKLLQLGQPEDPISTSAEAVSRFLLGVPSTLADLDLFDEEISWKGEVGRNVKPLKAMVLWVATMHPPPRLHYALNQLRAAMVQAPVVGRHGQMGGLPG